METQYDGTNIPSAEKPSVWKSYIKLIFKADLPWMWIIAGIIITLLDSRLSLMFPAYTQKITSGDISKPVVYGTMFVIIGKTIMSGIIRVIGKLTNFKIDKSFRTLIWKKLLRSPISLFDREKPTELVSRTSADTANVSMTFSSVIPTLIAMVYVTYGVIKELFIYDWRLASLQIIYIPLYIGVTVIYGKFRYKTNKKSQEKLSKLTQFISELISNIPLIKSFVNEEKEEEKGRGFIQSFYKATLLRNIVNISINPISSILNLIQTIIVLTSGVYLINRGSITFDQWIAYYFYVDLLYGVLDTFVITYANVKSSQGATARIAEILEIPEENPISGKVLESFDEDITFEDLTFGYGKKEVLKNLNFTIPNGRKTAIIGESGGGKTTILSLLQRFYNPQGGVIKLGDTPIDDYMLNDWRNNISYVSQDSPLLSGTIRENILYGVNRLVSDEEIQKVAKLADALEFINEFPQKFDTPVGESGSKLSGGQRQRISIARALLRDSDFLLFDEPTANLDNHSKKAIQKSVDMLLEGKTSIIIAHDISTIKDSDQIILLHDGMINGVGTHDELIKDNVNYQRLIKNRTDSMTDPEETN